MTRIHTIIAALSILSAATATAASDVNSSKNGTVTGGWLMAEDFQNDNAGDSKTTYNYLGENANGTVTITTDPTDNSNLTATFSGGDYNTVFEIPVTLPAGKTIADYKTIAFDLYRHNDDDNYKQMYIGIGNTDIIIEKDYTEQAPAGTWTPKSYALSGTVTSGNKILLHIGIKTNNGHYAIDNIRLEEREGSVTPPANPDDFHATSNGVVSNGELTVNDFQHHNAINAELPMWTRIDDKPQGSAHTAADPTDERNIVAHFHGNSDYNTVLEIPVSLPDGKKLADYSTIKFDLYRRQGDANYKRMRIQADDHVILYNTEGDNGGYEEHAPENQWTEKSYDIDKDNTVGNSFKLRLGIESDAPDYMIDNIRLVEKEPTTGITNPETGSTLSITPCDGGIIITTAASTEVRIHSIDGRLLKHTRVNGTVNLNLPQGVFIISTPSHITKVSVR